jgi:S-formylglutathione hydrolase FrmB
MGGNGALQLSLNYPGVFGTVGAHSPALRTRQQAPYFMGGIFPGSGATPGAEAYAARDPLSLVKGGATVAPGRLWIDIGQQDIWAPRAQELHAALLERGWAHDWQPAAGGHDGPYWQRRLPEYVAYYLSALGAAAPAGDPAAPAPAAAGA